MWSGGSAESQYVLYVFTRLEVVELARGLDLPVRLLRVKGRPRVDIEQQQERKGERERDPGKMRRWVGCWQALYPQTTNNPPTQPSRASLPLSPPQARKHALSDGLTSTSRTVKEGPNVSPGVKPRVRLSSCVSGIFGTWVDSLGSERLVGLCACEIG